MASPLDYLMGLGETGATLGTGAMSGLLGMPYGLYKGVTSGKYGTPEGVRIAEQEAANFMARNTYQPRTEQGQQNLQQLAGLLESTKLPPVIPEAALLGQIPRQAYAAQAERAGMAAERALAPVVERTMQRGGRPAQLLQDLTQGSMSPMDVWHGSPHGPIKKFDSSKIGTGEGAQAYGHGLYFGEARGTGEGYRRALSEPELFTKGKKVKTTAGSNMDTAKAWLQDAFESGSSNPFEEAISKVSSSPIKDKDAVISALQKLQSKGAEIQKGGYLYKVDLPDEAVAKMIDWDKPLTEQSKSVQDAIKNIGSEFPSIPDFDLNKWAETGPLASTWHNSIVRDLGVNPQDVASILQKRGITGIKYLDEQSRNMQKDWTLKHPMGGEQTFPNEELAKAFQAKYPNEGYSLIPPKAETKNFVVFPQNESLLTIKEINDQPVGGLLAP